ncbi:T6SS immunity protein Tli3 family protein [Citrobacter braakii]|uniref:T6SS immunity protein Tli3 family protein n=1 Tax=Citrobacter braakii TaxID=57706 RepID=UPI003C2B9C92
MKLRSMLKIIIGAISLCAVSACTKSPSQVIYRYDDNRYLELKGFNCEGALWYHDTTRNIHKELIDGRFASFRVFTGAYIHPSDKYIFIPDWEPTAYLISKDYGQTWRVATYMASFPALERNSDGVMRDYPEGKEIKRVVVVNNQAFITTSQNHLYMSSYPFDDPRLKPGGPGIDYKFFDDTYYLYRPGKHKSKGKYVDAHMRPESPGAAWGTVVFMKAALAHLTEGYKANYQNLPDKEPEVVGYKGWTRMRCDLDAGK